MYSMKVLDRAFSEVSLWREILTLSRLVKLKKTGYQIALYLLLEMQIRRYIDCLKTHDCFSSTIKIYPVDQGIPNLG